MTTRRPLLLLVLSASLVVTARAQTLVYEVGVEDNFAPNGAEAPAPAPSQDFLATLPRTASSQPDEALANFGLIHSFDFAGDLAPGQTITGATLSFRVAGAPVVAAAPNAGDGVSLVFSDANPDDLAEDAAWSRPYGDTTPDLNNDGLFTGGNGPLFVDGDTGLLTPGVRWNSGSNEPETLNLAALPNDDGSVLDLLPQLSANGFLDVFFGDDSATDFVRLTITVVPEPSAAALLLTLSVLGLNRPRDRGHRA